MTSPLMFKALDTATRLGERMLPLVVSWDIKSQRFVYRRTYSEYSLSHKLWFLESFILFGVLGVGSFLVNILFILKSPPNHPLYLEITSSPHFLPTRFVLSTVFFGGCIFVFSVYRWGADIGEIVNGFLDYEKRGLKEIPNKKTSHLDILGLFMVGIIVVDVLSPPIPAIVTVYRGQDSYYTVLRLILPQRLFEYRVFRLVTAFIRILILAVTAYEIGRVLVIIIFLVFIVAMALLRGAKMQQLFYEKLDNAKKLKAALHVFWYRQFFLLMRAANTAGSAPVYTGLLVLETLFVTMAIILIKLREQTALPILIISVVFLIGLILLITLILPLVVSLYEDCVVMVHKWRNDPRVKGDKRYLKAKIKSLEPYYVIIGFELHKLQRIDREFSVEFLYGVVSHTIDMLLAIG